MDHEYSCEWKILGDINHNHRDFRNGFVVFRKGHHVGDVQLSLGFQAYRNTPNKFQRAVNYYLRKKGKNVICRVVRVQDSQGIVIDFPDNKCVRLKGIQLSLYHDLLTCLRYFTLDLDINTRNKEKFSSPQCVPPRSQSTSPGVARQKVSPDLLDFKCDRMKKHSARAVSPTTTGEKENVQFCGEKQSTSIMVNPAAQARRFYGSKSSPAARSLFPTTSPTTHTVFANRRENPSGKKDRLQLLEPRVKQLREVPNNIQAATVMPCATPPISSVSTVTSVSTVASTRFAETSQPGLANLGNTCYMNSTLQALYTIEPFIHDLLQLGSLTRKDDRIKDQLDCPVYMALYDVFSAMRCNKRTISLLGKMKEMISIKAPRFLGDHQEDAHELFVYLIDQCKEEVKRINEAIAEDHTEVPEMKQTEYFNPALNFEFETVSKRSCDQCGEEAKNKDICLNLSVDMGNNPSLQGSVDGYFQKEILKDYTCEQCGHMGSTVINKIQRLPRVMIVHLKRYQFDNHREEKKTQRIRIPSQLALGSHCTEETVPPPPPDCSGNTQVHESDRCSSDSGFVSDRGVGDIHTSPVATAPSIPFATYACEEQVDKTEQEVREDETVNEVIEVSKKEDQDRAKHQDGLNPYFQQRKAARILLENNPNAMSDDEMLQQAMAESLKDQDRKCSPPEKRRHSEAWSEICETCLKTKSSNEFCATCTQWLENEPPNKRTKIIECPACLWSGSDKCACVIQQLDGTFDPPEHTSPSAGHQWVIGDQLDGTTDMKKNSGKEPLGFVHRLVNKFCKRDDKRTKPMHHTKEVTIQSEGPLCDLTKPRVNLDNLFGDIPSEVLRNSVYVDSVSPVKSYGKSTSSKEEATWMTATTPSQKPVQLISKQRDIAVKFSAQHNDGEGEVAFKDQRSGSRLSRKALFHEGKEEEGVSSVRRDAEKLAKIRRRSKDVMQSIRDDHVAQHSDNQEDTAQGDPLVIEPESPTYGTAIASIDGPKTQEDEDADYQKAVALSLRDQHEREGVMLGVSEDANNDVEDLEDESETKSKDSELCSPPCCYRLMSVVSHIGAATEAGHYVTDAYNMSKNKWYTYSDTDVNATTEDAVRRSRQTTGYIFFYMHKDLFDETEARLAVTKERRPSMESVGEKENWSPQKSPAQDEVLPDLMETRMSFNVDSTVS